MFRGHRHAGYIALKRELRLQHEWQLGDWYWNESTGQPNLVGRREDGSYVPFRDPAWLPPLTHWLDALRAEGIVSIEFTRDSDDPAVRIIRAWGSGPWRTIAEGQGPTDEDAAAALLGGGPAGVGPRRWRPAACVGRPGGCWAADGPGIAGVGRGASSAGEGQGHRSGLASTLSAPGIEDRPAEGLQLALSEGH